MAHLSAFYHLAPSDRLGAREVNGKLALDLGDDLTVFFPGTLAEDLERLDLIHRRARRLRPGATVTPCQHGNTGPYQGCTCWARPGVRS